MKYQLSKGEVDDFISACDEEGLDFTQFRINGFEINDNLYNIQLEGDIKISKEKVKQYNAEAWPGEFAMDVKSGFWK